ncbi:MAG: DUF6350 family protein [Micrococcaceae bacterium]
MKFFKRKVEMPLSVQAVIEMLQNAFIFYVLLAIPMLIGFAVNDMNSITDIGDFSATPPLSLSAAFWLLGNGTPLIFTNFTYSLMPLGLMLIPVWLAYNSGKRLMAASPKGKIFITWIASVISYFIFALIFYFLAGRSGIKFQIGEATTFPVLVMLVSLITGSYVAAGSFENLVGAKVKKQLPLSRRYLYAVMGGVITALLSTIAISALLLGINIIFDWSQATVVYEEAELGVLGIIAMFFAQLFYLPNFIIWALSWLVHTGFSIGKNHQVTPMHVQDGPMPLVPLTASVPGELGTWSITLVFLVILAGIAAGVWFWRNIPLEIDKELGHQIDNPWVRNTFSALASSLCVGVASGLLITFFAWLSTGAMGPGNLNYVGVHAGAMGLRLGLLLGLGEFLGHLAAPWVLNYIKNYNNPNKVEVSAVNKKPAMSLTQRFAKFKAKPKLTKLKPETKVARVKKEKIPTPSSTTTSGKNTPSKPVKAPPKPKTPPSPIKKTPVVKLTKGKVKIKKHK